MWLRGLASPGWIITMSISVLSDELFVIIFEFLLASPLLDLPPDPWASYLVVFNTCFVLRICSVGLILNTRVTLRRTFWGTTPMWTECAMRFFMGLFVGDGIYSSERSHFGIYPWYHPHGAFWMAHWRWCDGNLLVPGTLSLWKIYTFSWRPLIELICIFVAGSLESVKTWIRCISVSRSHFLFVILIKWNK